MLEWLKQEMWLIPNWAWFAIFIGVACLIIAIVIIACCVNKKGDKTEGENTPEPVLMLPEAEKEEVKEEKVEEKVEEPVAEPEPVPVEEEKPAAKKTTTKTSASKTTKSAAAKPAEKKEEKPAAKTTSTKTTATKSTVKPAAKAADKKDDDEVKVYHISKREDKKWQVRIDGGDRALKLFFTQKEAIDYTRQISGKKRILVHKEDGGVREV